MPSFTGQLAELMTFLEDDSNVIVAHLAKNPIATDADVLTLADLVEADFPGYAPIPLANFDPQDYGDDTLGEALCGELNFEAGAIVQPQTVYAVYLTLKQGSAQEDLFWPVVLERPIEFINQGDVFPGLFRFQMIDTDAVGSIPVES